MSVEQTDKIDFISTEPDGSVVLTVSDHLEWDRENRHLLILQSKLNAYLAFIESGQISEAYPSAQGKPIVISVRALYPPTPIAREFLSRVERTIRDAGFSFRFSQHNLKSGEG